MIFDYLSELYTEFEKPSPRNASAEATIIRGLAHAVLGGAFSLPLMLGQFDANLLFVQIIYGGIVGALYFVVKELDDIKEGGTIVDAVFDTAFVMLGTLLDPVICISAISLALFHGFLQFQSKRVFP